MDEELEQLKATLDEEQCGPSPAVQRPKPPPPSMPRLCVHPEHWSVAEVVCRCVACGTPSSTACCGRCLGWGEGSDETCFDFREFKHW